jgi:hypothetical protein
MKSALLKAPALALGVFLLLSDTESLLARGGRGGGGRGGGGRAGGGGGARAGGMGGGGRSFSAHRPAVSSGGFGGGGGLSRPQNVSRPSSSRTGGMVPNKNISGGNLKGSQAASKVQSRPKSSASSLPSTAQAKRPAGAGAANKGGFPDLAAKAPSGGKLGSQGQLAGKAQGAQGGQLAGKLQDAPGGLARGKLQGAQGGQLAGKLQGAQAGVLAGGLAGGALAGGLAGAQGGELGGRLQGGNVGQLGNNFSPQRNQAIADRQKYWDKWGKDNQGKLDDFRTNRGKDWGNINNFRKNQNPANSFNKPEWNNYKNNVDNFRNNRSVEINNDIQNHFDNNFNDNWWASSGWYRGAGYWGGNPWWWWGAATFATAGTFLAIDAIRDATYTPPVYDYGVNVVYQGDQVYVDGKPTATAKEYSQKAIALANAPAAQPPSPTPPEQGQQPEWLPLGVWALAQEEKGDAYMFFQISIDKNGVVTGAYQNVLSGEKAPISGQVDKKTQRVAWKIGTNNTVIETGLQSLTQEAASCLVHFGPDRTQTWLLVRLKQPEMPNAPQSPGTEAPNKTL